MINCDKLKFSIVINYTLNGLVAQGYSLHTYMYMRVYVFACAYIYIIYIYMRVCIYIRTHIYNIQHIACVFFVFLRRGTLSAPLQAHSMLGLCGLRKARHL